VIKGLFCFRYILHRSPHHDPTNEGSPVRSLPCWHLPAREQTFIRLSMLQIIDYTLIVQLCINHRGCLGRCVRYAFSRCSLFREEGTKTAAAGTDLPLKKGLLASWPPTRPVLRRKSLIVKSISSRSRVIIGAHFSNKLDRQPSYLVRVSTLMILKWDRCPRRVKHSCGFEPFI
jgi:hypothetical protein